MIPANNRLNYIYGTTLTAVLAIGFIITPAFAGSPHFVGTPTITKTTSGATATVTVNGKVVGLGSASTQIFLTTSGITAMTECGGNRATVGPTGGQTTTIQPRNGQITFSNAAPLSITVTPGQAGCPPGATPTITSATFTDVVLHIVQNGQEVLTFNFGTVTVP